MNQRQAKALREVVEAFPDGLLVVAIDKEPRVLDGAFVSTGAGPKYVQFELYLKLGHSLYEEGLRGERAPRARSN